VKDYTERLEELARVINEDWTQRERPLVAAHRPPIVTLCGSTRFGDVFRLANRVFTNSGIMVFTVGSFGHEEGGDKERVWGPELSDVLDRLHVAKVLHGDYVVMLNVDYYVGSSAHLEYVSAKNAKKPVLWLEHLPMSVREIINEWAQSRHGAPKVRIENS